MDARPIDQIALIGFGEVGGIFGRDFAAAGFQVCAYDILLEGEPSRSQMLAKAKSANVRACDSMQEALRDAELVISAVTAASSLEVAKSAAPLLRSGQIYLDINSVSPETKRQIACVFDGSSATFVEAAVMAPVSPQRLKVPMLIGGASAAAVAPRLQKVGLGVKPISERVGAASAIKMCRSIIIKGLEAITLESMLTARRYGAEDQVLASLAATYPGMGWDGSLPDYDQPSRGTRQAPRSGNARSGTGRCGRGFRGLNGPRDGAAARLARASDRGARVGRPERRSLFLAETRGRHCRRGIARGTSSSAAKL